MSLIVLLGFAGLVGLPQDTVRPRFPPAVETAASRLFNSTMSPFCPGLLLANCPSPQAAALKDSIRVALASGAAPESIRGALEVAYGEGVRATPPARGFGLLAWLVPGVGLVAGLAGIAWWLRRGAPRAAAGPAPATLTPEERARLERELADL
jgi:cytochrome c-type biogenesis protein CcmH/NrfF